jgi:hypothetical protein
LIGGMELVEGQLPRFFQAYVHDVAIEGLNWHMQNPNISLAHFMTFCNHLVANPIEEVHICITVGRTLGNEDVCSYNVLTTNEVAMIILSEPGEVGNHDVIV